MNANARSLNPNRFPSASEVRDGVELAYVREGEGGYPLLLVHGWPETKRIWWRNIEPLAAGRLRGDRPRPARLRRLGLAPDGFYDLAAYARDLHALVHDVLGHERCAAAGGDVGGGRVQDLACASRASSSASACSTRCCRCCRGVRGGRHPAARCRARCAWRPTTSCARARRRRARRGARHAGASGAATSRSSTARASGPRPARFTRRTSTS